MSSRPECELENLDLKEEYVCGHCGKIFCHADCLVRHRTIIYGENYQYLVCDKSIKPNDCVKVKHENSNSAKKELKLHNACLKSTDKPDGEKSIAMGNPLSGATVPIVGALPQRKSNPEDDKRVPMKVFKKELKERKMEVKPKRTHRMSTGANVARIRAMWKLEQEKENAKEEDGEGGPSQKKLKI